jgi:hypothetical protein
MDPYQTIGVPRNCTREELKEAFREKARLMHPDRGGDPAAFIRLREAFDQISSELDRMPPVSITETPARPVRRNRRPNQPDPNWEPELIVRDEPLPRLRPARTRDPNWQPDLIVRDLDPRLGPIPTSREARISRQRFVGFLSRFRDRLQPEESKWRMPDWNISGLMALLLVTILTLWICWAAWRSNDATAPSDIATKFDPVHATK